MLMNSSKEYIILDGNRVIDYSISRNKVMNSVLCYLDDKLSDNMLSNKTIYLLSNKVTVLDQDQRLIISSNKGIGQRLFYLLSNKIINKRLRHHMLLNTHGSTMAIPDNSIARIDIESSLFTPYTADTAHIVRSSVILFSSPIILFILLLLLYIIDIVIKYIVSTVDDVSSMAVLVMLNSILLNPKQLGAGVSTVSTFSHLSMRCLFRPYIQFFQKFSTFPNSMKKFSTFHNSIKKLSAYHYSHTAHNSTINI